MFTNEYLSTYPTYKCIKINAYMPMLPSDEKAFPADAPHRVMVLVESHGHWFLDDGSRVSVPNGVEVPAERMLHHDL